MLSYFCHTKQTEFWSLYIDPPLSNGSQLSPGGLRLPDVPSILKQKSSVPHDQVLYMGEHVGTEWEEEASEDSITHSSRDSSLNAEEEGRDEEPDDDSESDWRIFKVCCKADYIS